MKRIIGIVGTAGASAALIWTLGCAGGGGGGSGSGATSTISGNVSNQSTAMRHTPSLLARVLHALAPVGEAYAGRAGIHVSVNGIETDTDPNGFFVITGPFSGPVTVSFGSGNRTFTMQVDVPPGATVVLRDVFLRDDGTAHPSNTRFRLSGALSAVSCATTPQTLTLSLPGGDVTVALDDATRIQISGQGSSDADCQALASQLTERVRVEGTRAGDGSLVADRVKVHPTAGEEHDGDEVEFHGTVTGLACPDTITVTRTDGAVVTVHLSPSTEIGGAASCSDLDGAAVEIEGRPEADGSVDAGSIDVDD